VFSHSAVEFTRINNIIQACGDEQKLIRELFIFTLDFCNLNIITVHILLNVS
jgi:hypothetical protein